jgi:hypothetical protein
VVALAMVAAGNNTNLICRNFGPLPEAARNQDMGK